MVDYEAHWVKMISVVVDFSSTDVARWFASCDCASVSVSYRGVAAYAHLFFLNVNMLMMFVPSVSSMLYSGSDSCCGTLI